MPKPEVTEQHVLEARERILRLAVRTPLLESRGLSERVGSPVYLKLESVQETGSFKVRGAASKMLSLSPGEKKTGIITISTGNHGRAVAYVAGRLGIRAIVCIPEGTTLNKVQAIRGLGAEILVTGETYDEAEGRAMELAAERGLTMINPYDDPLVIAGQGTTGLEIVEELPEVGTVLVPVGGGGLIAGIGLAVKAGGEQRRLVGVSMDRAPVMYHSLRAGHPVVMEQEDTLADALVGGIGADNQYTFNLLQRLVDDFVLVADEEIARGMLFALREHHLVVEGGGAVGIGALLGERPPEVKGSTVVVVSGGNVDLSLLVDLAGGAMRTQPGGPTLDRVQ